MRDHGEYYRVQTGAQKKMKRCEFFSKDSVFHYGQEIKKVHTNFKILIFLPLVSKE